MKSIYNSLAEIMHKLANLGLNKTPPPERVSTEVEREKLLGNAYRPPEEKKP